jgi:hypothetical protein
MGSSPSVKAKNTTDIITKAATEVLTDNIQNCHASISGSQSMNFGCPSDCPYRCKYKGISQIQNMKLDLRCTQNAMTSTDIQNKVAAVIAQKAKAEGVAGFGALGADIEASNHVKIRNSIKNTITTRNVSNMVSEIKNKQEMFFRCGIFEDIHQEQGSGLISSHVQELVNSSSIINEIENQVKQDAEAVQKNPLAFIGDAIAAMFGAIAGPIMLGIAGVIVFMMISSMGGGGGQGPMPMPMPMPMQQPMPMPMQQPMMVR